VVNLRATIPVTLRSYYSGGFAPLGALLNKWADPKFYFRAWIGRFTKKLMPKMESRKESNDVEEE
jgi:hypothetical protein